MRFRFSFRFYFHIGMEVTPVLLSTMPNDVVKWLISIEVLTYLSTNRGNTIVLMMKMKARMKQRQDIIVSFVLKTWSPLMLYMLVRYFG